MTIAPVESVSSMERRARKRLLRDGSVIIGASANDDRQVRQLNRLRARFADDPSVMWAYGPNSLGETLLVLSTRRGCAVWWCGEIRTG